MVRSSLTVVRKVVKFLKRSPQEKESWVLLYKRKSMRPKVQKVSTGYGKTLKDKQINK